MNLRAIDDGKATVATVEGEKEIGAAEQDCVSALVAAKLSSDGEAHLSLRVGDAARERHPDVARVNPIERRLSQSWSIK